jgi:glycerol-3-phosphate dehydrogenase
MVAVNHRVVNTIINRCKIAFGWRYPGALHTVAVMGTTDIKVVDPDHVSIEPWEIRLMLDEGQKIIPRFKEFRILRAWAGVRPLIQDASSGENRDLSRAFTLLDHSSRDGVEGIVTITSGKWTTYRKMAEATVDKVCEKLNVSTSCRTHLEPLPSIHETKKSGHYLGAHLREIEKESTYGQLVCECELATKEEVENAIIHSDAKTIDDIRRDVRLGMGPCQGAFCALRAIGMIHEIRHQPVEQANVSLRDFLQERWKGNIPILWGQQLRQERFNELIYIDVLNTANLPGKASSNLSSIGYAEPGEENIPEPVNPPTAVSPPIHVFENQTVDVIIVGAGLAGLITAWRACSAGLTTQVITKGWGATYSSSGCIDIFGYKPLDFSNRIDSPGDFLDEFTKSNTQHPYSRAGVSTLEKAVHSFLSLSEESGYPFYGSLDTNLLLPTALGTLLSNLSGTHDYDCG